MDGLYFATHEHAVCVCPSDTAGFYRRRSAIFVLMGTLCFFPLWSSVQINQSNKKCLFSTPFWCDRPLACCTASGPGLRLPRRSLLSFWLDKGLTSYSFPPIFSLNLPQVCVVVPAQRAAALGLSHLPGHHSMTACTSRGSPPRDVHFTPLAPPGSSGGGHSGYPSHTRSHSYTAMSATSRGGGGGYGHHADQHHAMGSSHHVSPKASHSYGAPPPSHMGHLHERRERAEPRGYSMPSSGGGSGNGGPSISEYERAKYDLALPSTSYPPPGWSGDMAGTRGMGHGMMRSQSPPSMMRSAYATRNGGGAPRPPPTPPRGYDNQYPSSRYGTGAAAAAAGPSDGFSGGMTSTGRRHSGSSAIGGRGSSMRQEALAASNHYYSVGEIGGEHGYDRDFSYAGPSRMA